MFNYYLHQFEAKATYYVNWTKYVVMHNYLEHFLKKKYNQDEALEYTHLVLSKLKLPEK